MKPRVLKTLAAAVGLMAAATGGLSAVMDPVVAALFTGNMEFLDQALKIASGHFIALSILKGSIAVVSNIQLDLSLGAGIILPVGKVLSSVQDLVDMVWTAFGYSLALVWAQKLLLEFFGTVSLTWLFSIGCAVYLAGDLAYIPAKKHGAALALTGLVIFLGAPATVALSGKMFSISQSSSARDLERTSTALKNSLKAVDLLNVKNIQPENLKKTLSRVQESLNNTGLMLASAATVYISRLLIFLFLSPFLFYGLLYLGYKKIVTGRAPPSGEEKTWVELIRQKFNNTGSMENNP